VSRRRAYAALAALCALPRLAVLLHERGAITASYTEKGDVFAGVYVKTGTYGFLPGHPSAYTQPLYGFFLIPVRWLFGSSWLAPGLAHITVAVATVWVVYEIARRLLGSRWAVAAAATTTLNPYLVWHDAHLNREILDQLLAAAVVLLTLVLAERPSKRLGALLGLVSGLAILGNVRLVGIPILCALYLLWRLRWTRAAAVAAVLVLAGAGIAVAPWLVRNKLDVGCWTLTTDGRSLWKANNSQTYGLLSSGRWIDDVSTSSIRPPAPNRITPEEAWGYLLKGRPDYAYRLYPNECVQMSFYEHQALEWVRAHPGAKAKLGLLSLQLLWQPSVTETTDRPAAGTQVDIGRRLVEPAYMWVLYVLAAAGLLIAPVRFVALALLLEAYNSAAAFAFVGTTRYRIALDFLVALLATAALARAAEWTRSRLRADEPVHT
jgi:4-amino-4-deoxy-L-arabinose transferase-like glycosyltransferase